MRSFDPMFSFDKCILSPIFRHSMAVICISFAALFVGRHLLQNAFFTGHDVGSAVEAHLSMLGFFGKGQILPVWVPDLDLGYGAPFFNFYQPAFYLCSAFLGAMGIPVALAINLTCFLALLATGLAMYAFVLSLTRSFSGALLSGVAYLMAPYHLVDLYIRGSYAEFFSFIFMPLILLGILRVFNDTNIFIGGVLTSLSVAGLLLAHNGMSLLFLPAAFLYILFLSFNGSAWKKGSVAGGYVLIGLGLAAFFWLPALLEKSHIPLNKLTEGHYHYSNNFLSAFQLFFSSEVCARWSLPFNAAIDIPVHLGWAYIIGLIFVVIAYFKCASTFVRRNIAFFFGLFLVTTFMTTAFSSFIWENVSLLKYLQFPSRFLGVVVLALSICLGLIGLISDRWVRGVCFLIIGALLCIPVVGPAHLKAYPVPWVDEEGALRRINTANNNSYLYRPIIVKEAIKAPAPSIFDIPVGVAEIRQQKKISPAEHVFDVTTKTPAVAAFYQIYFPGWTIKVNSTPVALLENKHGIILFQLMPGDHKIHIRFDPTPVHVWGNAISAGCFFLLIFLFFVWVFKRK